MLDAGGTIGSTNIVSEIEMLYHTHAHTLMTTCAAECMRQYLNDCVEFVCDLHTISKVKVSCPIVVFVFSTTCQVHWNLFVIVMQYQK